GPSFEGRRPAAGGQVRPAGEGPAPLEGLQGGLLLLLDVEEFIEFGDLKYLVYLRIDVAQDQPAAYALQLLVEGDQLAQRRAGEVLDVAEVEQELAAAFLVDEAEELFADHLNVLLVEDFLVDEVDHRHVADVLDFQTTTARLGRHTYGP